MGKSAYCQYSVMGLHHLSLAICSFILIVNSSCSKERELHRPEGSTHRTILAYIAADNNLRSEAEEKCTALLHGWQPSLGSLLIATDNGSGRPMLLKAVERNNVKLLDTLRTYQQDNMADANLLKEVITDMPRYAPASCYGLILFSHATGWLPEGAFSSPLTWQPKSKHSLESRSIFNDQEREMEIDDMARAIPDHRFCFIVFDMCFMGSVEALYPLRQKAPKVIVSAAEILSPGFTPIYRSHLASLYKAKADLRRFASAFYDYWGHQEGLYRSAAISIINMHELYPLAKLVRHLGGGNRKSSESIRLEDLQVYNRHQEHKLFFDLKDYLYQLSNRADERREIDQQIKRLIPYQQHTGQIIRLPLQRHSGLSIYIQQEALPILNTHYQQSQWWAAVTGKME